MSSSVSVVLQAAVSGACCTFHTLQVQNVSWTVQHSIFLLCCTPQFLVHVALSTRCRLRLFHELSSTVFFCCCAASRSFWCMLHFPHVAGSGCFMNCPAQYFSIVVLQAALSGACCTFHTLQAQNVLNFLFAWVRRALGFCFHSSAMFCFHALIWMQFIIFEGVCVCAIQGPTCELQHSVVSLFLLLRDQSHVLFKHAY